MKTKDGYLIPMSIHNGLPCLKMHPPTDKERKELPMVHVTEDLKEWNPLALDHSYNNQEDWYNALEAHEHPYHNLFNEYGEY